MVPGDPAPSLRSLAQKYGLSKNVVAAVTHEMVDEGWFHVIPRLGTFVGRPVQAESEHYLLLGNDSPLYRQLLMGFEDRMTQLGGVGLGMETATALEYRATTENWSLHGIFDLDVMEHQGDRWQSEIASREIACVRYGLPGTGPSCYDTVSFDDRDGGRQAAQHLLSLGHSRIAFLALHAVEDHSDWLSWSVEREAGWREAMTRAGLPIQNMAIHPVLEPQNWNQADQIRATHEVASNLIGRRDITAVVAANDHAAMGLLQALKEASVPHSAWPAIVGFDNDANFKGHRVTSMRLPWQDLGRVAADVLWDRRHGRLTDERIHRQVKMRLIPRLTCRPNWSIAHAEFAVSSR